MFWNKKSGLLYGASRFKKNNSKDGAVHDWLKSFNSVGMKKDNSKSADLGDLKDKVEKLNYYSTKTYWIKKNKQLLKKKLLCLGN